MSSNRGKSCGESRVSEKEKSVLREKAIDDSPAKKTSLSIASGKHEDDEQHTYRPSSASLSTDVNYMKRSPSTDTLNSTDIIAIKCLVSNNVAGSIIGKAGQSVSQLQNESNCRIKLSQANDCFPGTPDRVCLLEGKVQNIRVALRMIFEKIREQQTQQQQQVMMELSSLSMSGGDTESRDHEAARNESSLSRKIGEQRIPGTFVVRLLVPSASCGMLIGRGGCNIKSIAEKCNVKIQLAQKEEIATIATSERIFTVTGDMNGNMTCANFVIDGMVSHPELGQYLNQTTSYKAIAASTLGQAAATAAMTIHPPTLPTGNLSSSYHQSSLHYRSQQQHQMLPQTAIREANKENTSIMNMPASGLMQTSVQMAVASSSSEHGLRHPGAPVQQSGLAPIDYEGSSHTNPPQLIPPPNAREYAFAPRTNHSTISNSSLGESVEVLSSSPMISAVPISGCHPIPQQHPTPPQTPSTVQVAVPDSLVGGLLGRGGAGIAELQFCSGAQIKVSDRGDFIPGTTNRIVLISGTAQSCATAQFLINQRMALQVVRPADTNRQQSWRGGQRRGADRKRSQEREDID